MISIAMFIILLLAVVGVHIGGLEDVSTPWLISLFLLSLLQCIVNELPTPPKK